MGRADALESRHLGCITALETRWSGHATWSEAASGTLPPISPRWKPSYLSKVYHCGGGFFQAHTPSGGYLRAGGK